MIFIALIVFGTTGAIMADQMFPGWGLAGLAIGIVLTLVVALFDFLENN